MATPTVSPSPHPPSSVKNEMQEEDIVEQQGSQTPDAEPASDTRPVGHTMATFAPALQSKIDFAVKFGQSTYENFIKPNVILLIHTCDPDPRIGTIIAAPILIVLVLAATFLALHALILSCAIIAVVGVTIIIRGALVPLLSIAMHTSGLASLAKTTVKRARGIQVPNHVTTKSPTAMAIIGFVLGANVWLAPRLAKKLFGRRRNNYVTILPWPPQKARSRGMNKVLKALGNFGIRAAEEILRVIVGLLLALTSVIIDVIRLSIRSASSLWPLLCLGLAVYCLVLHYRTLRVVKQMVVKEQGHQGKHVSKKGKAKEKEEAEVASESMVL